jgi:CheY-like chemotaxis protein
MEKNRKILIVDDDVDLRETYAEVFESAGFDVMEACDGVDALDKASKEVPDVIFTGIIMPRMDGFSLMEALKKTVMTANIPVIISSHMGREEDQQKANVLGARDFIVRNVTGPKEVIQRINAVFLEAGGEYRIEFDPFALDAQRLARDLNFQAKFRCMECDEKMAVMMKLKDVKNHSFEARFMCPKCGWESK